MKSKERRVRKRKMQMCRFAETSRKPVAPRVHWRRSISAPAPGIHTTGRGRLRRRLRAAQAENGAKREKENVDTVNKKCKRIYM